MKYSENKEINFLNYMLEECTSQEFNAIKSSSSPDSFPEIMKDGIIVNYNTPVYISEIISDKLDLFTK